MYADLTISYWAHLDANSSMDYSYVNSTRPFIAHTWVLTLQSILLWNMNLYLVRSILHMQNHLRHFPLSTQFMQVLFWYYHSTNLYIWLFASLTEWGTIYFLLICYVAKQAILHTSLKWYSNVYKNKNRSTTTFWA